MDQKKDTIQSQFNVTEVELIYRNKVKARDRSEISNSKAAFEVLLQSWDENKIDLQEQFKILLLSTSNRCLGIAEIGLGGPTSCVADPRIIFATALKGNASKIILAHNHPSGSMKASQADVELTRKIIQAGKLLDIVVLDHIILTSDDYSSLADKGFIPL